MTPEGPTHNRTEERSVDVNELNDILTVSLVQVHVLTGTCTPPEDK